MIICVAIIVGAIIAILAMLAAGATSSRPGDRGDPF